eukprot:6212046-Pleurochrysis_carterae.AAC.2
MNAETSRMLEALTITRFASRSSLASSRAVSAAFFSSSSSSIRHAAAPLGPLEVRTGVAHRSEIGEKRKESRMRTVTGRAE